MRVQFDPLFSLCKEEGNFSWNGSKVHTSARLKVGIKKVYPQWGVTVLGAQDPTSKHCMGT
jgi:hypothetical protein